MVRCFVAIVLAAAAADLAGVQIPAAQTVIEDPEAYVVYAALIATEVPRRSDKAKQLVIQRETVVNKDCMVSGGALATDWKPVADDFKLQNARVRFILPDRDLHRPYVVVTQKDLLAFFSRNGGSWPAFYKQYPDSGGYVEVSAVGFDRSKTQAMVYVSHYCGGLCGGGSYHLLEKSGGTWREADVPGISACMWIS
jgi:hypothetical protein